MQDIQNHNGRHIHYFDSLGEFLAKVEPKSLPDWSPERMFPGSKGCDAGSWRGGLTTQGIYDLAKTGAAFDAKLLDLRDKLSSIVRPIVEASTVLDVTGGSEFNMGAYCEDQPECVWAHLNNETPKQVVSLVFNGSVSSGIDARVLALRGLAFMALVDAVEMTRRYRVNVYAAFGNRGRAKSGVVIKLKDTSEQYDPQALAACLTQPAFFRHTIFSYWDVIGRGLQQVWGCSDGNSRGMPDTVTSMPDYIDSGFITNRCLVYQGESMPIRNLEQAVAWIVEQMAALGIKVDTHGQA